jgi:hypothetical protein
MEKSINKTEGIRDLGKVDIRKIKQIISKLSAKVWELETAGRENNFDCFHHTEHIIFRFPDQLSDRTIVHDNPTWHIWKSTLLPIMEQAIKPYGYANGVFKAVMLAKLKAGHAIDRHTDGSLSYYFLHKIHIPIETNEKVSFYIEPNEYSLAEGKAYEVNNIVTHGVVNQGQTDRIHLIFEYLNADLKL